ncbi:hypothetical protein BN2364_3409 [Alloalcanivorax xenomutans]|nr:hypothetical protein BN2364_3409 [Alloalcanivorax xenomutans]
MSKKQQDWRALTGAPDLFLFQQGSLVSQSGPTGQEGNQVISIITRCR